MFFDLAALFETVTFICISLIMVSVALRPSGIREAIKASSVLFISSALLGGIMSALYSVMSDMFEGINISSGGSNLTPATRIILSAVSLCGSLFLTRLHGTGRLPEYGEGEVVIWKKKKILRGVFDTGNLLTDPLSGRAVIVVKASCLRGIISNSFINAATSGDAAISHSITDRERARFRLIPAKGIGGSTYLYGLVPDSITVIYTYKGKTKRCERDAVIAFIQGDDTDFDCIIPSSII